MEPAIRLLITGSRADINGKLCWVYKLQNSKSGFSRLIDVLIKTVPASGAGAGEGEEGSGAVAPNFETGRPWSPNLDGEIYIQICACASDG